eukprot:scaffold34556_cov129-Isochrysis_galbana.AAC.5
MSSSMLAMRPTASCITGAGVAFRRQRGSDRTYNARPFSARYIGVDWRVWLLRVRRRQAEKLLYRGALLIKV